MCTVTFNQQGNSWLVTMNRDERRTRHAGEPPSLWHEEQILAPRDPEAGGTWIGVRRDGTWACLLNGYEDHPRAWTPGQQAQTRGRLIPNLLRTADPTNALSPEDLADTLGFQLWLGFAGRLYTFFWNGESLKKDVLSAKDWHFTTSSSVHQADVTAKRKKAFQRWLHDGARFLPNGLPSFHVEPLGLAPDSAVLMTREHSHTKSCTQIIIGGDAPRMKYWRVEEMKSAPSTEIGFGASMVASPADQNGIET